MPRPPSALPATSPGTWVRPAGPAAQPGWFGPEPPPSVWAPVPQVILAMLTLVVTVVLFLGAGIPRDRTVVLPDASEVRPVADAAVASVVKVVARGCLVTSRGSGFLVGPGLVLTNAHVVGDYGEVAVEDRSGVHPATPVLVDPSADVAILRAEGVTGPALRLHGQPLRGDERGAVLGFPGGGPLRVVSAAVRDAAPFYPVRAPLASDFSESVIQIQAHVEDGNSGGPFVGLDGTVLGVVFSQATAYEGVAYALRSDRLLDRIERVRQGGVTTAVAAASAPGC